MKKQRRLMSVLLAFCLLETVMPMGALAASEPECSPEAEIVAAAEAAEKAKPEAAEKAKPEATEKAETEAAENAKTEATEKAETEAAETPKPETTEEPKPETAETPKPETTEEPKPETTETPKPETAETPKPETTEEPKPETTETPKPETTEEPKPEATEEPKPEASPVPELAEGEAFVICEGDELSVPVRANADGQSPIIFTLPNMTVVSVLGVEGDWIKIAYQEQSGYVYKANIPSVTVTEPEPETETEKRQPKASIFSSRKDVMEPGETVTLSSRLENGEGYEIRYQWECDRGSGFEAVAGANEDHYSFEADQETLSYTWRLVVYYR